MIKIKEHLSDEEREQVLRRSNLRAWWQVLSTWSEIALLLALVSAFPNPLTLHWSGSCCRGGNWLYRC